MQSEIRTINQLFKLSYPYAFFANGIFMMVYINKIDVGVTLTGYRYVWYHSIMLLRISVTTAQSAFEVPRFSKYPFHLKEPGHKPIPNARLIKSYTRLTELSLLTTVVC